MHPTEEQRQKLARNLEQTWLNFPDLMTHIAYNFPPEQEAAIMLAYFAGQIVKELDSLINVEHEILHHMRSRV